MIRRLASRCASSIWTDGSTVRGWPRQAKLHPMIEPAGESKLFSGCSRETYEEGLNIHGEGIEQDGGTTEGHSGRQPAGRCERVDAWSCSRVAADRRRAAGDRAPQDRAGSDGDWIAGGFAGRVRWRA